MKKRHTVIIYTSPSSQFCTLTIEFFRQQGIEPVERPIHNDKQAERELKEKSGQLSTPVTEFDGRIINGYRPDLFQILLDQGKEPLKHETEK